MSVKLLVQNLPLNLNQDAFIKAFNDLRGFMNGALLLNQQNELYGIVEFTTLPFADFARKIKSNFKFPGYPTPITVDFLKNQGPYDFHSGSMNAGPSPNTISPSAGMNQNGFPGHLNNMDYQAPNFSHLNQQRQINEIEGQSQGNYMQNPQQRYSGDNIPNNEMYNALQQNQINPNQMGYNNYQNNPNQFNQQSMNNPMHQMQNPNVMPNLQNINPHLNQGLNPMNQTNHPGMGGHLNYPNPNMNVNNPQHLAENANRRNFQPRNNMNNFQFMQNQQPQGNIQQHFNQGPGGNSNMLFKSNQHPPQNKPTYSEEDLVMFKVPSKATSSIYVDGIPIDASEREVSHVFRPFPGFQEVRLIKKEAKGGRKFYFCFVDFDSALQSTIALETLQGYRFDKSDENGLSISYAFQGAGKVNQDRKNKFKKKY